MFSMATIAVIVPVVFHFRQKTNEVLLSSRIIFIGFCLFKFIHLLDETTTTATQGNISTISTTRSGNSKIYETKRSTIFTMLPVYCLEIQRFVPLFE
jgi:hypothetical protein